MKKIVLGIFLISSLSAFGNDVILKPGKSVILEVNVPTRVLCEAESCTAPYLCRLQFETSIDLINGQSVPTALKITMKNKISTDNNFDYLRTKLFNVEDGRNEQERASYSLENDRILIMTNDELNSLVARGICQKH